MSDRDYQDDWTGKCPAGRHGLDYRGQICDLCPPPPFAVWRQEGSDPTVHVVSAPSAKHAAEHRAAVDRQDPSWIAPAIYRVRDGATGQVWDVTVDLVQVPSLVAIDTREVAMLPATHVLWGGNVLCEDPRLRFVPRNWPTGQRWISLQEVADGSARPNDGCDACWTKAPKLVEGLLQIGKSR